MSVPLPPDEGARLEALRRYGVLDTPPEAEFDDLAMLASTICQTPIALITLVDEHRQFFKAVVGLDYSQGTPRDQAFCAHTILSDAPFIVEHAPSDPRFVGNPQVTGGSQVRFYAGAPLITPDGHRVGSLCVIDRERRQLTDEQVRALQILARAVVTQLELRRTVEGLNRTVEDLGVHRQLLEASERLAGLGTWRIDVSTGRAHVSPVTTRIFGLPPGADHAADAMQSRIHPEDLAEVQRQFIEAKPGQPIQVEYRLRMPDGMIRHVETRAEFIPSGAGPSHRIWGTTLDVTRYHHAVDALSEGAARYRLLFENSPRPMWVFDDETLQFLAVNNAALEQYGYSREEFLRLTLRDIRPAEDAQRLDLYRQARPGTQMRAGQWRHRRRDGTVFDVDVASHAIDWQGRMARLAMATDVTDRLNAERSLRASEQRLALVLEVGGLGFWDFDLVNDQIVLSPRAAGVVGFPVEEISPATSAAWNGLIHPDELPRIGELWERHASGASASFESEHRVRTKQGEWRWVHVRGQIIERSPEGAPVRMLGTTVDISDRKRLETHFLRAQRMESIGTLAGGIAHDLNNVLTPILMGADLLRAVVTDPQALGTVAMIEESATRGADMVRQVLSFARGYEGSRSEVDPAQTLDEVARISRETFPRDIVVEMSADEGLWTVAADPTQLHQVLLNLCVNARDAMPTGGHLRLHAENAALDESYAGMSPDARPGRYVVLSVTDTGAGIPAGIKDRIFDPFFTTKEPGAGTGLGLSTALAIVRSHGGFMTVYSERDRGATFRIYLPASEGGSAGAAAEPEVAVRRGRGELVLIVDDEAPIRAVCRRTLEAFGYRVSAAADGAEAVALYAQHRDDVSLVLLDMMMPIMDGPATARAMLRVNPQVRIIGASGLADSALASRALSAGVRQLIAKPYTAETLLETIARVLDES